MYLFKGLKQCNEVSHSFIISSKYHIPSLHLLKEYLLNHSSCNTLHNYSLLEIFGWQYSKFPTLSYQNFKVFASWGGHLKSLVCNPTKWYLEAHARPYINPNYWTKTKSRIKCSNQNRCLWYVKFSSIIHET